MARQGEAASYYQMQEPANYPQQPPQYNPNYAPPPGPPPNGHGQQGYGEKTTFDQTFKLERPRYHDWWAGLLLIAVFVGFAATSGIVLQGYSRTISFNGGIYGSRNDFGLDSNTIILFAFVLVVSMILSYVYLWMARVFTKQFICMIDTHAIYGGCC